MKRSAFLLMALALSLGGCQLMTSSTSVESVKSEKPSTVTLKKVLVFGVNVSDDSRQLLEQSFARALGSPSRTLVLSSDWYPDGKLPTREVIAERVRAEGVTGILVTRLVDYSETEIKTDSEEHVLFTPPRNPGTRVGWVDDTWMITMDGLSRRDQMPLLERKAVVETKLYDVETGNAVWTARTRTLLQDNMDRDTDGFVKAIVRKLKETGWL
ncbi:MAG: hypothetical protein WBJ03_06470 [Moraxellaceae bacterium]